MIQSTRVEDKNSIFNVSHAKIIQSLQNDGILTVYLVNFKILTMGWDPTKFFKKEVNPIPAGWNGNTAVRVVPWSTLDYAFDIFV